jgi:hypothetical protein
VAIEPCVDNTPYPVWPEYVGEGEKFAFGCCPFPDRNNEWDTSFGACVRSAAMTSLDDVAEPGVAIDQIVDAIRANAGMAARNNQRYATDVATDAIPSEVKYTTTAHDATKTMVWTGYMNTRVVPTCLRRGSGPVLGLPARSRGLGRQQQDHG